MPGHWAPKNPAVWAYVGLILDKECAAIIPAGHC